MHLPKYLLLPVMWMAVACGGAQTEPNLGGADATGEPVPAADGAAPAGPAPSPAPEAKPQAITKAPYGKVDGQDVDLYTLKNANGSRDEGHELRCHHHGILGA